MITKSTCEVCNRVYIPSVTSNPVKCASCNAVSRSPRSARSDLNGKLVVLTRVARKKPKKVPRTTPESWGKLPDTGGQTSLCCGCGEIFNSVAGFDAHRKGEEDRYCLTPDEMRKAGMSISDRGMWITSEFIASDLERLRKDVATA